MTLPSRGPQARKKIDAGHRLLVAGGAPPNDLGVMVVVVGDVWWSKGEGGVVLAVVPAPGGPRGPP